MASGGRAHGLRAVSGGYDHFGPAEQSWMLDIRVQDLAAMVAQLRDAGIEVEVDPESYPNGLFAGLRDPEGNPIQLWQSTGLDS